jgi:pyruvate formate lyase activating enzyme
LICAPIFDVKRYAINDGPGIRMTVFLKGCPLTCDWCHNPEGRSGKTQRMYSLAKCIGCSRCIEACPRDALELTAEGIVTDTSRCDLCGECAKVCPAKATEMSGELATVEGLMEQIEKETIFFDQSGGGLTVSGGEPLMYPEFLIALFDACGEKSVHRTLDTTGLAKTETLLRVAERTDHFLYDLKLMDTARHKRHTGVGNEAILENLTALAETGASINIRIPLIAGINDDDENIRQTAAFVAHLAGEKKQVNLLPYHNIAAKKYEKLGQEFDAGNMAEPDPVTIARIVSIFEDRGLPVVVGG